MKLIFLFQGIDQRERDILDFSCPIWFREQISQYWKSIFSHSIIGERVESHLKMQGNEKCFICKLGVYSSGGGSTD